MKILVMKGVLKPNLSNISWKHGWFSFGGTKEACSTGLMILAVQLWHYGIKAKERFIKGKVLKAIFTAKNAVLFIMEIKKELVLPVHSAKIMMKTNYSSYKYSNIILTSITPMEQPNLSNISWKHGWFSFGGTKEACSTGLMILAVLLWHYGQGKVQKGKKYRISQPIVLYCS